jgi:ribosomal protein S18 acetylase RimI-like enzyme
VAVTITAFNGQYEALAAWTGESPDDLRRDDDYHDEDRGHWLAWENGQVVGVLHPWRSPDGRHRLYFGRCRPDTYGPLAAAIDGEAYVQIDIAETQALAALRDAGFAGHRLEHEYWIPVAPLPVSVPPGLRIITADQSELEPLMLLDCAIRADIPGSQGWQPDPQWFREETYDSPFFDPQTYRIALDADRYVGLARIWLATPASSVPATSASSAPAGPAAPGPAPLQRLGCVGVLAGYRRRGLARAMIAAAFAPLHERGVRAVSAEVDESNAASNALMASLGATVTGGTLELRRPP